MPKKTSSIIAPEKRIRNHNPTPTRNIPFYEEYEYLTAPITDEIDYSIMEDF